MHGTLTLFALFALLATEPAIAGDAKSCVRIGSGSNGASLVNMCGYNVEVFWCHNRNEEGYTDGVCGGDNYYQKHHLLKAGETKENRFSLPSGARISYGACKSERLYSATLTSSSSYGCPN